MSNNEILFLPPGSARELFKRGDMKIITPQQEQHQTNDLVAKEHEALTKFFGQEILVPYPPQELFTVLSKAKEIGWNEAEAHYLPKIEMKPTVDVPGWKVKPGDWYWYKIAAGEIAKDAAILEGIWVIVDGSQKPPSRDRKQMYENDPFASVLSKLRNEGKIQVPDWCRNIPTNSRFGISYNELQAHVNPAIANLLGVQSEYVRLPKAIEFNILGNMNHPVWGETDTWELFEDIFGGSDRLIGGCSDDGGLASGFYHVSDGHNGDIGFRPLVAFPTSPAGSPPKAL